ncbi:hypothetical protein Daudx_0737 [Candidatus Desulforudis audaxviator]|nr:hypothetical protein Daudx_0737 [Candidatus Desulforudis audaxviator]
MEPAKTVIDLVEAKLRERLPSMWRFLFSSPLTYHNVSCSLI